jgi:phosphinothricin acetyltransferase
VTHHVRAATERDLEAVNDIYNAYVVASHATFDLTPVGSAHRLAWFREHDDDRYRVFVSVAEGVVTGYASSSRHRPKPGYETTVETSVYVSPDHLGRGIGASLYSALFEALQGLDLHRALAGIAMPNEASVALHRRFGFHPAAHFTEQGRKFGRYWDVDWFERALD